MESTQEHRSATIHLFPRRGRFADPAARRAGGGRLEPLGTTLPVIESGAAWYHEAAVAAERPRKP